MRNKKQMSKIEIYGTIGPACAEEKTLEKMFRSGMTGIRLNLSHAELEECRAWTNIIQAAAQAAGVQHKLLIDLQGPELRVGNLNRPLKLSDGAEAALQSKERQEAEENQSLGMPDKGAAALQSREERYKEIAAIRNGEEPDRGTAAMQNRENPEAIPLPEIVFSSLQPEQAILLDDGKIQLTVTETEGNTAHCKVTRGGMLQSRKSIALPGIRLNLPVLTESDKRNIRSAKSHGVTGVMLPFVRSAENLKDLQQELKKADAEHLEIFAKIENMDGVNHLEELLPFADQIVIARGDLGNSMPLWELPPIQAQIAQTYQKAGKPFMVVTQMLATMEQHPVPTRAEMSDIFLAVLEGAASVMVTGETAVGKYPQEVIEYLSNTVKAAKSYISHLPLAPQGSTSPLQDTGSPISWASTVPPNFPNSVPSI